MDPSHTYSSGVTLRTMKQMILYGLKCAEAVEGIEVILYDNKDRMKSHEELVLAESLHLTAEITRDYSNCRFSGILPTVFQDNCYLLTRIGNKYFSIEPTMIQLSGNGTCHEKNQRNKSLKDWRSSRIRRIIYGLPVLLHSLSHIHEAVDWLAKGFFQRGLWLTERSRKECLRNFFKASRYSYSPKYMKQIPLPIFFSNKKFSDLTDEWLALMTWYKTIAQKLEPLNRKLTAGEMADYEEMQEAEKLRGLLYNCNNDKILLFQAITGSSFAKARYNAGSFFSNAFEDLLSFDISDLQNVKIKPVSKNFIMKLFNDALAIVRLTVAYIMEIRQEVPFTDVTPHDTLRLGVAGHLNELHLFIKRRYYKKWRPFRQLDEEDLQQLLLQRMGIILKVYFGETLTSHSVTSVSDELAQYRNIVEQMHNFLKDLIIEIAFTLIDAFYDFYKIKVVKDCLEQIIQHITIVSTSAAVIAYWESTKYGNIPSLSTEMERRSHFINKKRLSLPTFSEFVSESQEPVGELLVKCMDLVFEQGTELSVTLVLASLVCEDFLHFQRALAEFFGVCPHPMLSPEELMEKRLYHLMSHAVITFEDHRKSFEEVLQLTEQNFLPKADKDKP